MKLIILAAGRGSRLGHLTDDCPKCMVEYKRKPIIDYTLEAARRVGLTKIVLIKGYKHEKLLRDGCIYYLNENYSKTNMVATLFCAASELNDDCIISYSDIIYKPEILEKLKSAPYDLSIVVDRSWRKLWESRMSDPLNDAETMKVTDEGKITELGKKPRSYDDIQGQYIGLFKFSKKILPAVISFYSSLDRTRKYDGKDFDNMYMTSFLQLLIDRVCPAYAVDINGGWLEIDSASDLLCEMI